MTRRPPARGASGIIELTRAGRSVGSVFRGFNVDRRSINLSTRHLRKPQAGLVGE
jgi:hypothetical protein